MEELQEVLRNAEQQVSTNFVKEIKLDEVSTMHEVGPIVYDWIKIGQDGNDMRCLAIWTRRRVSIGCSFSSYHRSRVSKVRQRLSLKSDNMSLVLDSVARKRLYRKKIELPEE